MDCFSLQEEFEGFFRLLQSRDLPMIAGDWEPTKEDPTPFVQLTIGFCLVDGELDWDYQTGCTQYSGGASRYADWHQTEIYEESDCAQLAFDALEYIYSQLHASGHKTSETGLLWSLESNQYKMNSEYAHYDRWSSRNNIIKTYDPHDGNRETLVTFFFTGDSEILDLPEDQFALVAKVTENPGAEPLVRHYSLGTFPAWGSPYESVKWAGNYAFFAYQCFERDQHFSACPSSELIHWVDKNFNPVPQKTLADPDIGGVW